MAVVSKALRRRRCLYRSPWPSCLLLPRALSSFIVDDGPEIHRDDATVASTRPSASCAQLEVSRYDLCAAAHRATVYPCVYDRAPLPAADSVSWCCRNAGVIASTQTAKEAGRAREDRRDSGRRRFQNRRHIPGSQSNNASAGAGEVRGVVALLGVAGLPGHFIL
jgi:hypothetical protein